MVGLTYLLILEPIERFRSGHLHGHHAICGPPTLLQSTILLLIGGFNILCASRF